MPLTSDPLLSTKLRPSQDRSKLVARSRLVEGLDRGRGLRLTLLSAPAGFGKTTLLSRWSRRRAGGERSSAWLSLDEGDNDPARFLSYLVAALRKGTDEEGFGEGVRAALLSPTSPRIEALIGIFTNDLADLSGEVAIVLDDYHLIHAEGVHGMVAFLLEHLPENVHLIISSRVDPPLPLPKLRARNQMAEIGAEELAFTPEEAATFLKGIMGLDLSAEDVATLGEITEGWIAGLQLAALSMRGREDLHGFVEAFSGSHRDVLDFLAEEVLERQPDHVRDFLLDTSILDGLTGPLCDALTGRADGHGMLERLGRENLFVVALDDERLWYRYHHLFRDFLRGRLRRERPECAGQLHLNASGWYEGNGYLAEAIEHALSAPDHERAARLMERGVKGAWSRGEGPTVLRWLEAFPAEVERRRPRLLLQHAQALVLTGRPDDAGPLLIEAERAAEATSMENRRFLLGFASAIHAWRARLRGDAPQAGEFARRALSLLPEEEGHLRNFSTACLGDALRTTGDLAAASEAFAEAVEIGQSAGHVYGILTGLAWHARVQVARGRVREADDALHRALRLATEQGIELLPAMGAIHIGIGVLLYERNDLDGAERELKRGMELAERTREVINLAWGYITLSKAKWAQGDEEAALRMAREADRVARASVADPEIAYAGAWMVRLRLAQGDLAQAAAFAQERAANTDAVGAARLLDRITSARLLHARGRHGEALVLLEEPREAAEEAGRGGELIEILSLRALALWAMNEKEQAVNILARALALGEPEGYVRTFVDEGAAMGDLLSGVLDARQRRSPDPPVPAHYLRKLLAATERDATGAAPPTVGLSEPLTGRELEVLVLIAAGKSNRRIATELYVGVGTVKTHVRNLYRKLEAHSRTHALARARELNLI